MKPPFFVKFCGVTREEDMIRCLKWGADAIGLNLYPKSPRYVSEERAAELAKHVEGQTSIVLVMVDPSPEHAYRACRKTGANFLQLHGTEDPVAFRDFPIPIVKAITWRGDIDAPTAASWREIDSIPLVALLVDAFDPVQLGGSGKRARWDLLYPRPSALSGIPLVLAGGIQSETVTEAIQVARPDGIDCASGIESSPGLKSEERMQALQSVLATLDWPR